MNLTRRHRFIFFLNIIAMLLFNNSVHSFVRKVRPTNIFTTKSRFQVNPSSSFSSRDANMKKLEEFRSLLKDCVKLAADTGVKIGIKRTIQLVSATTKLTSDFINKPELFLTKDNQPSLPKILRKLFEELGATYIKLGQFVASSPTLFPAEYVLEFQSCLDKSVTVPFSAVTQILESELKTRNLKQYFSYIDPVPVASASIAQVHKAVLVNGTQVCIKVQKPGVDSTLIADLNFLSVATKLLEFFNPSLSRMSLANIVTDIKESMFDELDFNKESSNLVNFREFLAKNGITDAVAPMPYLQLCTKRVLTMEFLKGVPLVDLEGIRRYTSQPEQTLISALRTWAISVTANDRFHADLHGGNLLVLEDGRVGFIDFGIVGRIPERVWGALGGLVEGLAEGDFKSVARALVQMGATTGTVNEEKFAKEVKSVFEKISQFQPEILVTATESGGNPAVTAQLLVDEKETTELVLELVKVADENGLRLPREFGFLLKQALYFDRYQKLLAPDVDPLRDSRVRDSFLSFSQSTGRGSAGRPPAIIDAEIIG